MKDAAKAALQALPGAPERTVTGTPEAAVLPDDRPPYADCSVETWQAAKVRYAQLSTNPAWAMQASFRTSAVAAAMGNGSFIDPLLCWEFKTFIESRNYRPRVAAAVAEKPSGDALAALGWAGESVPTAAPPNDYAWIDSLIARRQGLF